MKPIMETERLFLRNLQLSDADEVYDYRSNPKCSRFQRWEDTSPDAIRAYLGRHREDGFLSRKEEQHYAVCAKNGALVGEMAYFYSKADRCITLGITISYAFHRNGFAFEILEKVIAEIRSAYPRLDIVALIEKENLASIRLFEKLGFYRECYAESIGSYVYVIDGEKEEEAKEASDYGPSE